MPYAIIKTGGKQFVVEQGSTVRIPLVDVEIGKSIELDALLTGEDGDKSTPIVGGAKVSATVIQHGREHKLVVFKKKRRKHYKRKQGHRQSFTAVRIDSFS